ncbi:MAG: bifunctional ornithine acetyltransferase/N-acetylglutamate synthase [Clostridia bacterium]|nr:bifunctional ornithine acetyltransferase/N-acetylglutamate synthase [Clostridia bacterium]
MRKNGVNREIQPIEGGICAPAGFQAGAVSCGICPEKSKDLAVILAQRRCPCACVYSTSKCTGAPIAVTKKHVKDGYAQAILVNGGIANVFQKDGVRFCEDVCTLMDKYCGVSRDEVVIASTGKIGESLKKEPFEKGLQEMKKALGEGEVYGFGVAEAIASENESPKQVAFSFEIGDFVCKIGAVFKGSMQACPNMATTLAFLTTDVCIAPAMLQKALETEVRETLNMLDIDGVASPNDTVCILASGSAGNCRINALDSDYEKFSHALRRVLFSICKEIAKTETSKPFLCNVQKVKSKQIARKIAKKLAGNTGIRKRIKTNQSPLDSALCIVTELCEEVEINELCVSLRAGKNELVLMEDGKVFPFSKEYATRICAAEEIELCIVLNTGNFNAVAIGCVSR